MKSEICLIAGANSEIGVAIAEKFADDYHLVLCWHKNHDNIDRLLDCKDVSSFQLDFTDEEQVDALLAELFRAYGKVDVMINCVGKSASMPDSKITGKEWDEVVSANLKPAFLLCQGYRKCHDGFSRGCIINLSSTAGIRPLPSSPHYVAAKAGLIALSCYYAKVMAPAVRVNVIAPGFALTSRHADPKYDAIKRQIPLGRLAKLSEIAETAAYIVDCTYITGQTIVLDGGLIS